jgi:hypothetical protein
MRNSAVHPALSRRAATFQTASQRMSSLSSLKRYTSRSTPRGFTAKAKAVRRSP